MNNIGRLVRGYNLIDKEYYKLKDILDRIIKDHLKNNTMSVLDQTIDIDNYLIEELPKYVKKHFEDYNSLSLNCKDKAYKATSDFLVLRGMEKLSVPKVSSYYGIQAMFKNPKHYMHFYEEDIHKYFKDWNKWVPY